jgi:dTDP-glucose pyrophosphorylase
MTSNKLSENTWSRALLPSVGTIEDAIRNLNKSSLQIVLVISAKGILQGTITDGDIRRGLLRGLDLKSPVDAIVKQDALVAPEQMTREQVLQIMRMNQIHQVPIVDEDRRVVGLHLWYESEVKANRPNIMVIMAGGQGTRLGSYTESCPKPLLHVSGKPMLEHIIERAKAEGFFQFFLSINYLGHLIEDYFQDGKALGVHIEYLREKEPLGTAGSISLLNPRPDTPFIVTNGDVLTDIRYGELLNFHQKYQAVATMASRLHEYEHPFGVVNTNGMDILSFEEKPVIRSYVNAGVYAIDPSALECLTTNTHCHMTTLFERLRQSGKRTVVYPTHEPWLDVGRPEDLKKAQK